MNKPIHFENINHQHQQTIFSWLKEPHMKHFWDNCYEHKDDIINLANGRVNFLHYYNIFKYWVGLINNTPFCFIHLKEILHDKMCTHNTWIDQLFNKDTAYQIDFVIGDKSLIQEGISSQALCAFTEFFKSKIDPSANIFIVGPHIIDIKSKPIFLNAGFELIDFRGFS